MKPEFMRLRRALAGTLVALLMAVGIVVLSPALSASAHTPTVRADCTNGLSVALKSYPSHTKVTVVINGTTVTDTSFGGNWSKSYTWDKNVDNTYRVVVKSKDDPYATKGWSFTEEKTVKGCPPADDPKLSVGAGGCVAYGTSTGKVTFNLSGVRNSYTVDLRQNNTAVTSTTSSGGSGEFANVAPGTYTVKAWTSKKSVESKAITVSECAPNMPVIELVVEPCVSGGALGAVTAKMSNLNIGADYRLTLHSSDGTVIETKNHKATDTSISLSFTDRGPGTYYVSVAIGGGAVLASSAHATIAECPPVVVPRVTVQLEPCSVFQTGTAREISAALEGMAASTVYTLRLVTADAAATEIASTTTPGDTATTFTHTFTGVPTPGDYRVLVVGGPGSFESDTVTATRCGLDTLAPPSIELIADQCDGSGTGVNALTARMIDLDATKTYYVRIVDASGATAPGGKDRTVSGSTTATVEFPEITAAGAYTAQLLIDPDKQMAATSPASVDVTMCLPTLAMTGPGALVPLGGVAALLLTLGGAVVMGRLRRRMAL